MKLIKTSIVIVGDALARCASTSRRRAGGRRRYDLHADRRRIDAHRPDRAGRGIHRPGPRRMVTPRSPNDRTGEHDGRSGGVSSLWH